jgi:hypothetical protein
MKKSILTLLFLKVIVAQSSPFTLFDAVVYSEYYFDGIMVEVNGEVKTGSLPLNLEMGVPVSTDSVFFVSGTAETESEVKTLSVLKTNNRSFIQVSVLESKFRIFVFYPINKEGSDRSGVYNLEINQHVDDAHIVIQEPLVAENFTFSEKDAETFQDQHGLNFRRIHIHDYRANKRKSITFTYQNPSGEISINKLQEMLSEENVGTGQPNQPTISEPPVRHKLPLWQPLVLLGIVSVAVGFIFRVQQKSELKDKAINKSEITQGNYCPQCGSAVQAEHKFCANCGGQL